MQELVNRVSSRDDAAMQPLVVVVEDEPGIRQMLHDMLQVRGFASVGVDHPNLVLNVARSAQVQLFLIDMMLPGRSGAEVAEDLRTNGFPQTPMIAMSASRLMAQVASDSNMFDEVITKPFDFDDLFRTINRLLRHRDGARTDN